MSADMVALAAKMHARLERRLSAVALISSNPPSPRGDLRERSPPGASERTISSSRGCSTPPRLFNDWEDDEVQRHGMAFEFAEEPDSQRPLVPHQGPVGWRDADFHGLSAQQREGPFSFVEDTWFRVAAGSLISANVALLFAESTAVALPLRASALDAGFLALYALELACRLAHYRAAFFVEMPDAPWNWVDFAIVISGICDEWLLSVQFYEQGHGALLVLRVLQPIRFLCRFFRFLPYLRLLRLLLKSDLKWVESNWFQSLAGLMIILNALVMGLETDLDYPLFWLCLEQVMLTFFVAELAFRIRLRGLSFFTDIDDRGWNLLDLAIVLSGASDAWLVKLWHCITRTRNSAQEVGHIVTLARMLRLMRILRLVRVVKAIRPLRQLAIGVVQAMYSMFWVLVLTFVALYSLAILTTRMIGWGQLVDDPEEIPAGARSMFRSTADSMFTLFAFMNGHEWHMVRPLLDLLPWTKPLFVAFTICGSWALLSVMTGVVSDHIQYVREQQQREDEEAREERREQLTVLLSQIFASADTEGRGYMSRDAFMDIFNSQYQVRRLMGAIHQPVADVKRIFDWLDVDGSGRVGFADFCEGLDCLEETVTGQRLLKVDSGVKLQCRLLQKEIDCVSAEVQRLQDSIDAQHREFMAQIGAACAACTTAPPTDPDAEGEEHDAPLPPLASQVIRRQSSQSLASGSDSGNQSRCGSEVLASPASPLTLQRPAFRYSRSVSSLRSFDTIGSRNLRKSVSFCESVDEVSISKK